MSLDTITYARARPGQAGTDRPARPYIDWPSTTEGSEPTSDSPPIRLAREADFQLGVMSIRPSLCEVHVQGVRQRLQPREMQVLVALARVEDRVVSRDALIDSCWGGRIVGDDAINRCIGRLRRLARTFEGGFCIETLPRVGYRLNAAESGAAARETFNALNLRGAFMLIVAALAIGAAAVLAGH